MAKDFDDFMVLLNSNLNEIINHCSKETGNGKTIDVKGIIDICVNIVANYHAWVNDEVNSPD